MVCQATSHLSISHCDLASTIGMGVSRGSRFGGHLLACQAEVPKANKGPTKANKGDIAIQANKANKGDIAMSTRWK